MLFTCCSRTNWASGTNVLIAAGSRQSECWIFNSKFEAQGSIHSMTRSIFCCDISNDGEQILLAGGDGVIRTFRISVD